MCCGFIIYHTFIQIIINNIIITIISIIIIIIIIIIINNNDNNLFDLLKYLPDYYSYFLPGFFLIPREKEPPGLWELTFKLWDKLFTLSPVLLFLVPFWLFCFSLVFYSLKYCFNASVNYVIQ